MKKMTFGEFNRLDIVQRFQYVDSLQSELEALEGRKGFVVDWSKAPEWAKGIRITWDDGTPWNGNGETCFPKVGTVMSTEKYIYRPIPPKVARERTDEELTNALIAKLRSDDLTFRASAKIRDLCTAAGISLTSE